MVDGWHGVVLMTTARLLWPGRVGRVAGWAFTRGIPVRLEVRDDGLVVASRTRFFAGAGRGPVVLPWSDVVGVSARSRGHTGATGGIAVHETSDVTLQVRGDLATRWSEVDVSRVLPELPGPLDPVALTGSVPVTIVVTRGASFVERVRERLGGPPPG